MPDLPGAMDEPYDTRFAKWMIKNKVGWAPARARRCSCTGHMPGPVEGRQPNLFHDSCYKAGSLE
jgi:hypothetical protein